MSTTEDDAPLIYGLEFQARALVAERAPTEVTRFMVGTLTLKMASNQIHIIELNDETGAIYSKVYNHPWGEIWQLDWSPKDSNMILSTYQTLQDDDSLVTEVSLWKANDKDLERQALVSLNQEHGTIKMGIFHQSDSSRLTVVAENRISLVDVSDGSAKSVASLPSQPKANQHGVKLSSAKWNPEEGIEQLAVLQGTGIFGWDPRTSKPAWSIDNCHSILVRDLDYNRNRSSVVSTCGDDGCLKFWDLRSTSGSSGCTPLASTAPHQHWVTAVRINSTHDQLVLTSSTDSTVCLSAVSSVASDPVLSESADLGDSILKVYDHHEDSVCAVEWSPVDPFTFASLSIDGRLLTSTVPNHHKYKILGI